MLQSTCIACSKINVLQKFTRVDAGKNTEEPFVWWVECTSLNILLTTENKHSITTGAVEKIIRVKELRSWVKELRSKIHTVKAAAMSKKEYAELSLSWMLFFYPTTTF